VSLAARNAAGLAHIVFQASATDQAGIVQIGDRGTSPGNILRRIAYLERPLTASQLDVPFGAAGSARAITSWPNPARGEVRFLAPGAAAGEAIDIFDVHGRRVTQVKLAGGSEARWNGRDAAGREVGSGVYLARRTGGPGETTKFLLLH
jgi:hypothetical protein